MSTDPRFYHPDATDQEVEDAITEESIEIYDAICEFDMLLKTRDERVLTDAETYDFFNLQESLAIREREFWVDLDSDVADRIEEHFDGDFIMLRYIAAQLVKSCTPQ